MKDLRYERESQTEWGLIWTDTGEAAGVAIAKFLPYAGKQPKYKYGVFTVKPLYGYWECRSKHTTLEAAKKAGLKYATREP